MSVYADLIFLYNFIFDFEILYIIDGIFSIRTKWYRLFVAALIGGMQGVFSFIPYFKIFFAPPVGIIMPIFITAAAFLPCSLGSMVRNVISFFGVSFFISGIVMFFKCDVKTGMITALPIVIYIRYVKNHITVKNKRVKIVYKEKEYNTLGLYDSGNWATYLGRPVIFGGSDVFKVLINDNFSKSSFLTDVAEEDVCVVSYKTVEGEGVCFGIRTDRTVVDKNEFENVVLAYKNDDKDNRIILHKTM